LERGIKLFGLSTNHQLAKQIAEELHLPLSQIEIQRFADGEIYERVLESVRGDDVFVISPIAAEVNDALMEIMIAVDALRRTSAESITVVLPYYGYARQDRKARAREPITAKLVASMLEMNGVDRVLTIDLHAPQIQGFFDIPVDHLQAAPLLSDYFYGRNQLDDLVVVSADHTGAGRARIFADLLRSPWGVINDHAASLDPRRKDTIVGDVAGRRAIVIDDIIDTGNRVLLSAEALHYAGATDVIAVATHAVLSGDAAQRLSASPYISSVIVTDTLEIPAAKQFAKLTTLSVAPTLAEAIQRIHDNRPMDELLKSRNNPDAKI
jgi:ribose-phosphate pyrophosphokinase